MEYIIDLEFVRTLYQPRNLFAHKGSHGHVLWIAGSHGKMGACVIGARACLKAGAGLLTAFVPEIENQIIQTALPEAMSITYSNMYDLPLFEPYRGIAMGCGFGTHDLAKDILVKVLKDCQKPLLLDADALNLISIHKYLLDQIPQGSVLTPHPKEFDRLFGESTHSMERQKKQIEKSKQYQIYIVLKGRYTSITTPDGICYFNTSGNPGMAKGGSGDALSGIIIGCYAQYQDMKVALLMSVFIHGLAGDLAAEELSEESMLVSDLVDQLPFAFRLIANQGSKSRMDH
jgi:NAD(P)H-hydrate epimerase